ncbi:MAG: nucleotidyltransferase family protein [Lachnospiraceae bacterium]|nr:nucleotidyltransferase family protein [Lachnospiraceae bacterium]
MSTVAVIAEFNPFHKGHAYFLRQARHLTGAACCLAIMSGDFVQRGAPAIYDMHMRGEMALRNGADLVLELPVRYACSSAEKFASGAVFLLNKLGVVDYLAFGAECDSLESLSRIADILYEEPESYRNILKEYLRSGMSFPAAREAAIKAFFQEAGHDEAGSLPGLLGQPNNILAIEYLKALRLYASPIKPLLIPRCGDYHYSFPGIREESDPSQVKDPSFLSAESIRVLMKASFQEPNQWKEALPDSVFSIITAEKYGACLMDEDFFSGILRYVLTMSDIRDLSEIEGISSDLAARIIDRRNEFSSFSQFTGLLKSKEITYTAISRALIHLILHLKKTDTVRIHPARPEALSSPETRPPSAYVRLLGLRKSSSSILHEIRKRSSLTLISKAAQARGLLSEKDYASFLQDIQAAHIYEGLLSQKTGLPFRHEFTRKIVILE